MDGIVVAFFVPTVIFMVIVAPAWIWMHYRSKQHAQGALTENERTELDTLALQAERMLERIDTLEAILDAETPDWRKRNGIER
ncbi:MAG: envelope stress response membrane protein PspB [Pseudomonadales bacterium]|jgi:phage shock protein B|nr:envelope stress response membrane protein PspB [Pseudomonadales bacterium]